MKKIMPYIVAAGMMASSVAYGDGVISNLKTVALAPYKIAKASVGAPVEITRTVVDNPLQLKDVGKSVLDESKGLADKTIDSLVDVTEVAIDLPVNLVTLNIKEE